MKIVDFGQRNCEKVRRYLDSYISNELLVESNLEVLRHIEQCSACSQELETRVRIRTSVQVAARREEVPPGLEQKIRREIRERSPVRLWPFDFSLRWMSAVAALFANFSLRPSGSACAAGENSARRSRMLISGGYPSRPSRTILQVGLGSRTLRHGTAVHQELSRPSRRWHMRLVRNTPDWFRWSKQSAG